MATDQEAVTQALTQAAVDATKAAVQCMAESRSGVSSEPTNMEAKLGGPTLKQPTFDWGSLKSFRLEVSNIFKTYYVNHTEQDDHLP